MILEIFQIKYHQKYNIFFFYDVATTEIYTLSLHDALPISASQAEAPPPPPPPSPRIGPPRSRAALGPPQPQLFAPAEIAPGTLPPVNLLQMGEGRSKADEAEMVRLGELIRSRCEEFGVEGTIEA